MLFRSTFSTCAHEYGPLLGNGFPHMIRAVEGDITHQRVDAIVNAAHESLLGGGGVDGAIHAAGGPDILAACQQLRASRFPNGLATGGAVATTGGKLSSSVVIHTVGPRYWEYEDGGADLLAACHTNSLTVAMKADARSVAFPAISCGVFGWKPKDAAPIAVSEIGRAHV